MAELGALTVARLFLDGAVAHIALDARHEKNREGNEVVLRENLAADLLAWLADNLKRL
jgi:hypothetical protein